MYSDKELTKKNIELSAEFSRYIFEHPEIQNEIPFDAEIILLPEYDLEHKEFNLKIGKKVENEGGKVVYVIIKSMRPKALSRIEEIELKVAV